MIADPVPAPPESGKRRRSRVSRPLRRSLLLVWWVGITALLATEIVSSIRGLLG